MIPFNISLAGMILPLFLSGPWSRPLIEAPALGTALSLVAQLVVAGMTVKTIWSTEKEQGSFDSYSLAAVAALLISPIAWGHYLFLAIPAFLSLELSSGKREQNFGRMSLIAIVGSSAIRFQDWSQNGVLDWYQCLPGKVSGVIVFAIWVLLVRKHSSNHHSSACSEVKNL